MRRWTPDSIARQLDSYFRVILEGLPGGWHTRLFVRAAHGQLKGRLYAQFSRLSDGAKTGPGEKHDAEDPEDIIMHEAMRPRQGA